MVNTIKINNGTEGINEGSENIDVMNTENMLLFMHKENNNVMNAIEKALPNIKIVVDKAYETISLGGRIIYVGAGTSGRLGIIDALECSPTFGISNDMFIGLIAGGDMAIKNAIEGAEDDVESSIRDLKKVNLNKKDILIGISASGKTPYVVKALEYAKEVGAYTTAIVNNQNTIMSKIANETIELLTGSEIISGSTRLKAGTSQKIVLNMISTAVMIKDGKVYKNLMVDLKPINEKLKIRAEGIVMKVAKVDKEQAKSALKEADGNSKLAIVMLMTHNDKKTSEQLLKNANGMLRKVLVDNGVNV